MITRVMRHFGMGYEAVLELPTTIFWMLNRNIGRLLAETELRQLSVLRYAQTSDESALNTFVARLQAEIGQVTVAEEVFDAAGFAALKRMAG